MCISAYSINTHIHKPKNKCLSPFSEKSTIIFEGGLISKLLFDNQIFH